MSKYWVLEHQRGGREVWDCKPFGPWRKVAGPFDSKREAEKELARRGAR